MMSKIVNRGLIIVVASLLSWVGWPLYGFVSNQFEVARLPWGWSGLPTDQVSDVLLIDEAYEGVADKALNVIRERRETIYAPSISAAIAVDGTLIWAGAVGWRDIENELPATINTAYRIGSTSKPVGITGLARLVTEGRMELDEPISTYADALPNEAWNQFTPRQLASHTAGLAAYEENNDWIGFYQSLALQSRFNDPVSALSVFDRADVLHQPGQGFHYSGFDNVLLSAVIQQGTGQSFDSVMKASVFEPLGLKSIQPDHLRTEETEFAISYQVKGLSFKPWRYVDLSHKIAAGGYVATPSELALLGAAWLDDDFISAETRKEFWEPVVLSDGQINEQSYALGFRRSTWEVQGVGDVVFLNHGGISKGAQCWLMVVPEHNMSMAISINRRTDQFFDFADVYVDLLELFIPVAQKTGR